VDPVVAAGTEPWADAGDAGPGSRGPWADRGYLESVCSTLDGRQANAGGPVDRGALRVEPGLTDVEMERAEARFELRFPADLRALLQHRLPVGWDWPNWRDPDADDYLRWAIGKPGRAMEFDVLNNGLWTAEWGERPSSEAERARIAAAALAAAPRLVPVHGHRYVPCEPRLAGNPVVSCPQIIEAVYGGNDLAGFFAEEFGAPRPAWATPDERRRRVPFWSAIIERGEGFVDGRD
jgi:hypothetical protein